MVGDFEVEFPKQLPNNAEELSLDDLCDGIQSTYNGKLGKITTLLAAKMISSKFPGRFDITKVREHLKLKWGLLPGRQDTVMLLAITKQPTSRILNVEDAKDFLDGVATEYSQQGGFQQQLRDVSQSVSTPAEFDSQALMNLNRQQSAMLKDITEALSPYLQNGPPEQNTQETRLGSDEVAELDLWRNEHGEAYTQGIKPMFSLGKVRQYDSFWNWNSQDIVLLCERIQEEPETDTKQWVEIEELIQCIMNRICVRSLAHLRYLRNTQQFGPIMNHLYEISSKLTNLNPAFVDRSIDFAPMTIINSTGAISFKEIVRTRKTPDYPPRHELRFAIHSFSRGKWEQSKGLTEQLLKDLGTSRHTGFTFAGTNVLITGAGRNSIAIEILKNLLLGGARVIVTTSSYSPEITQMYQEIYAHCGASGAVLKVLPFNQGSYQDIRALSQYIQDDDAWDLDFVVPFAAVSEIGRDLEEIDSKSEIAHRLMLTNLLRLLGAVARGKRMKGIITRPAQVILPLSPNHGLMGNDGLYSESKRALETLFGKWSSESWHDYLSLCGVNIGWTRGTGLMNDNDLVSEGVEAMGIDTFSSTQMASYLVTLMGGGTRMDCQTVPLMADFGGGLGMIEDFKSRFGKLRGDIYANADSVRALYQEKLIEDAMACKSLPSREPKTIKYRANTNLFFPDLPDYDRVILPLATDLHGMVDLSRAVVVTGFSEVGPIGSSRTRWDMEVDGDLSLNASIEMAWMMGFIKHHQGRLKNGSEYSGWIDTDTLEPIEDINVKVRYMRNILEHSGIRLIEPEVCDKLYDPERKLTMQEVVLQKDLAPFQATPEVAQDFHNQHHDLVKIVILSPDLCTIQLRAGATIWVTKATKFSRTVAGQIPTGWSAKRYGITDEIIEQVDTVTIFGLVCTVEALLLSGITDPYELYKYIHVTDIGNCIGSGLGGSSSLRAMYKDILLEKSVQGDILQETFINTTGAWINMLLMSSSGPIKTPVGACATSLESLDTAYEMIVGGNAKVCLVGGVEDFSEEASYGFASMKATNDSTDELAAGRSPREMSRPMASSRSGFVESQGGGVQVVTSGKLALEMGLPIFGIIAMSSMAGDKTGRSVPAPGRGILSTARERQHPSGIPSRLLNINYRKRSLMVRKEQIHENLRENLQSVEDEVSRLKQQFPETFDAEAYRAEQVQFFKSDASKQDADACFSLGNQFWKNETQISPMRGSLATWNLTIDDLTVASLHGTSTNKGDTNETAVIQAQMMHLNRQEGNLLFCVCQKWLTGHSKGAAGAWMVNGSLQMLNSGTIPGNRNLDNVDGSLRDHSHLMFPNQSFKPKEMNAVSVTSFGFGQKGAQTILVHPRRLFATIGKDEYETYRKKRDVRCKKASQHWSDSMMRENMLKVKVDPPYSVSRETATLLDPTIRFH